MVRFAKLATGLRDLGNDINANISKALKLPTRPLVSPDEVLLKEAKAGNIPGIEAVIRDRAADRHVNLALDPAFLSPLCLACAGGHEDAALFLLKVGADPNNSAGADAAATNAARGYPREIQDEGLLFGSLIDGESFGSAPASPLMLAVEAGLQRLVAELIAKGARLDIRRAGDGWTALHVCASRGHALIMQTLLSAPLADPGVRTALLETPLSLASAQGHLAVVDMLLGEESEESNESVKRIETVPLAGPLPQTKDRGKSAEGAKPGICKARRGSKLHAEERTWAGETPLHRAAAQGHTEIVHRLLAHGVSPSTPDARGASPLILAARQGHVGAAATLLKQDPASVKLSTREADTALHAAAGITGRDGSEVIRLLLDAGADVDARNIFGSTALHLAAAAGNVPSVSALLNAGANPSATNMCGLTPGACFLRPPAPILQPMPGGAVAAAVVTAANASQLSRQKIRRSLRKERRRHGQLRRLANTNGKRVTLARVAEKTDALLNRFIEFANQAGRWNMDALELRKRMSQLKNFRLDILSKAAAGDEEAHGHPRGLTPAGSESNGNLQSAPLLDMSSEMEGVSLLVIGRRRKAAAEVEKGAEVTLKDLDEWKVKILAEREAATEFLRSVDHVLAFAPGKSCGAGRSTEDDRMRNVTGTLLPVPPEADVVINDPRVLEYESEEEISQGGVNPFRIDRNDIHSSIIQLFEPETSSSEDQSAGDDADLGGRESRARNWTMEPNRFARASKVLEPCAEKIKRAVAAAGSGDRLRVALDSLREHVKATLIDLMDLETSIPSDAYDDLEDIPVETTSGEDVEASRDKGSHDGETPTLSPEDAAALDVKVGALLRRLNGKADPKETDRDGDSEAHPPSLESLYMDGLGGAAAASESEVDATERLLSLALADGIEAISGAFLCALDDAYQRLTRAAADIRRQLPEAKALLGGSESAEERAREARGRLIAIRQQVVDEEDHLEELVSKLRRRRRQAAGSEELSVIEDEKLRVRARLTALRSSKLGELKDLRGKSAYERFPELLLEHPDAAESAFRVLLLSAVAVRDVDEWGEHHMTAMSSVGSGGVVNRGSDGGLGGIDSWRGDRCRLAEVDDSAVAIVEVECRDREAKRALVTALLLLTPPPRRSSSGPLDRQLSRELARISAISLREGHALLEVPVEGSLSARAWLASSVRTKPRVRGLVGSVSDSRPDESIGAGEEKFQWEVWAVMLQALQGLAAVHAFSSEATHRAVCLENILVTAHSSSAPEPSSGPVESGTLLHGLRRAQLGPPAPAQLGQPPPESLAPEVVRGKAFSQAADIYAFGFALRAACCGETSTEAAHDGGGRGSDDAGKGGGSAGGQSILDHEAGPRPGPLRDSLLHVLCKMLDLDPFRRCTATEALASDYFRVPPPRSPSIYPAKWSPFKVERSRISAHGGAAGGGQPNWVAAAISIGRKDAGLVDEYAGNAQGWWDSCYAVKVPPPLLEVASRDAAERKACEWSEVEALAQRSLPEARLHSLVRLQDRGRWLRFACERDGAVASLVRAAAGAQPSPAGTGKLPVSCLFADPREVLRPEAFGVAADAMPSIGAFCVDDRAGGVTAEALVRCSASMRFAAVALALPTIKSSEAESAVADGAIMRTFAVVRAVIGVSEEVGVFPDAAGGKFGDSSSLGLNSTAWASGERANDPFSGVDPSIDDLTRAADIVISSRTVSNSYSGGSGCGVIGGVSVMSSSDKESAFVDKIVGGPAAGLALPTVNSIKASESLRGCRDAQRADAALWAGTPPPGTVLERVTGVGSLDTAHTVYKLRRDACYVEYLATFSFPAHAT